MCPNVGLHLAPVPPVKPLLDLDHKNEVEVELVPDDLRPPEVGSFNDAFRRSFDSWMEYNAKDPQAKPNRFAHEASAKVVKNFVKDVHCHHKAFENLIREKRSVVNQSGA
eukprot:symbB.v1.2.032740.t1/scaffold3964.1/size47361/4